MIQLDMTCLSWWVEAIDVLGNRLNFRISRVAGFDCIALLADGWLVLLLVALNVVAASFINRRQG